MWRLPLTRRRNHISVGTNALGAKPPKKDSGDDRHESIKLNPNRERKFGCGKDPKEEGL